MRVNNVNPMYAKPALSGANIVVDVINQNVFNVARRVTPILEDICGIRKVLIRQLPHIETPNEMDGLRFNNFNFFPDSTVFISVGKDLPQRPANNLWQRLSNLFYPKQKSTIMLIDETSVTDENLVSIVRGLAADLNRV